MSPVDEAKDRIQRVKANPIVDHAIRANARFTVRLGTQSAAGIAYYSVLSIVPILMASFAVLGGMLTVLRPDLLDEVQRQVAAYVPLPGDLSARVEGIIDNALSQWQSVGIAGLITGMWAGANWARTLKLAIRGQTRENFDERDNHRMFLLDQVVNLGLSVIVLLGLVVTAGFSSIVTRMSAQILQWLHWGGLVSSAVLTVTSVLVALVAGFALFWFLLAYIPREHMPRKAVAIGALTGAIATAALQILATTITTAFSHNAAATLFGPMIVVLLFLNVFANMILRIAAWVATYDEAPATELAETTGKTSVVPAVPVAVPVAHQDPLDPRTRRGFRLGVGVGGGIVLAISAGVAGTVAVARKVHSTLTPPVARD